MSTILFDFESRSTLDLDMIGGRLYWEGVKTGDTRAICCWLYEVESGEWALWLPGDPCPFGPGDTLAAHNMTGFDRFAVAAVGWRALDEGPPYVDTSEIARTAGLPGALDELAKRWLGREKDHAGNALTRRLSGIKAPLRKVEKGVIDDETGAEHWGLPAKEIKEWLAVKPSRRAVERVLWEVPADVQAGIKEYESEWKRLGRMPDEIPAVVLEFVIAYGKNDVQIMADAWPELSSWLDADMPGVLAAHRAVNDRGIEFDRGLAKALLREDARLKVAATRTCADALMCTDDEARDAAKSPKQFCEITGATDAQRTTVAAIDHPLATLRRALATIAAGKLEAGLALAPDGRMRDTVRYFGAHTGRWSGKGMQLQNMPRPDKRFETWGDAEICALAEAVIAGRECDAQEVDLLVRACRRAKPGHVLLWGDYSAVEGRGLAWAADDQGALDVYRNDLDPYVVSAAYIYQGETYEQLKAQKSKRQIGKVCFSAETCVLTERGWTPILDCTPEVRVWDGQEFVNQQGVRANGVKHTRGAWGLWATPDHRVLCASSWEPWCRVVGDESIASRALETGSANLPSRVTGWRSVVGCVPSSCGVHVGHQNTEYTRRILPRVEVADVTPVRSAKPATGARIFGRTRTCAPTTTTGAAYSIGSLLFTIGVLILGIVVIRTTVVEGSAWGFLIGALFWLIWSRFRGGTCPRLSSIVKTTIGDTSRATCASLPSARTSVTDGSCVSCNQSSTRLEPVYDLVNAGPRNRFCVWTERGPLIVHNCELALGYGGGEGAFANMAQGLGVDVSQIDQPAVIKAWRAGRRPTVQFWASLERAMIAAFQFQRETSVGAFRFVPGPKDSIALVLPSGRAIIYWGVRLGEGFRGRPSISYEGANFREHLYGGKLAENAIQAMCRDILADALVRLEDAGLPVVLHVHDEPVTEVPIARLDECKAKITEILHTLPAWAAGFPPKANIDHGFRYRK